MDKSNKIILSTSDGIATLQLNRPEAMNSLEPEIVEEFMLALEQIQNDNSVRVVVLTGSGKAFSAGGDLNYLVNLTDSITARNFIASVGQLVKRLMSLKKPVIAMVNGVAAGAGFNLALACDIIYCAQSARFSQSFAKVGLVPDCGGLYLLPRIVGFHKAKELMFTGDLIDSETALRLGIVNQVLADGELKAATYKLAARLAQSAPLAIGMIKNMVNQSDTFDLDGTLECEANLQALCLQTEDHKEGVAAFKEKRVPQFKGK